MGAPWDLHGAASAEPMGPVLDDVRAELLAGVPPTWPELAATLDELLPTRLPAYVVLPIAACRAAGGDTRAALPFAAAWTAIGTAVRILDDCADQDMPDGAHVRWGLARALNLGSALLAYAGALIERIPDGPARQSILSDFIATSLAAHAGQDRDIRGAINSLADYLAVVEHKTSQAFGFATASGARLATAAVQPLTAARRAGRHLGLMLQLLDDLEACFRPRTTSDLAIGKRTFPIWLALARSEHPAQPRLAALTRGSRLAEHEAEIMTLLEEMDMRRHVVWAAVEERDRALAALAECPGAEGIRLLRAFVDHAFADVAGYLQ